MTAKKLLSKKEFLAQILRVNHAGEMGAIAIYSGQQMVLKNDTVIAHMREQEQKHSDYFAAQLLKHRVRPTLLMPIWLSAGRVLGATTALLSRKAAMACTVAVEEVIDEHYTKQIACLEKGELRDKLSEFRAEELEHREIGLHNHARQAFGYKTLCSFIKAGCKLAIVLSKKF